VEGHLIWICDLDLSSRYALASETATHCSTLQHTAPQQRLQHTATHCNTLHRNRDCNTLRHAATLQGHLIYIFDVHLSSWSLIVSETATHCNTLHRNRDCSTLQHTATLQGHRISIFDLDFCFFSWERGQRDLENESEQILRSEQFISDMYVQ